MSHLKGAEPTTPERTCPKCGGGLQPSDEDRAVCFSCRTATVEIDRAVKRVGGKLAILRTIASLSDQVDRLETRLQLAEGKA